jgi:cytochrome c biogenesis protein CcmG, thiol:disulfide interchange protein DsbE
MLRGLLILPLVLFAGMAGLFIAGMNRDNPDALPSAFAGKPAPGLVVTALGDGPPLTDASLRAPGVKLVNFWASWCAPCRAEHPRLMELAAQGVPVYGVNYKDKPGDALGLLAELGNPFAAMGADASGRMGLDWGLYGVPETFVIDGTGTVVLRFPGPITKQEMERTILPAIAAAKP